ELNPPIRVKIPAENLFWAAAAMEGCVGEAHAGPGLALRRQPWKGRSRIRTPVQQPVFELRSRCQATHRDRGQGRVLPCVQTGERWRACQQSRCEMRPAPCPAVLVFT